MCKNDIYLGIFSHFLAVLHSYHYYFQQYVYIYIHIYMYVYIYIYIYICMYVCMYVFGIAVSFQVERSLAHLRILKVSVSYYCIIKHM